MFSDQPIKKSGKDLFGRKDFANRVAHIIASRGDAESIAIGIHAPWGEGKTSVLNMIVEALEDYLHKDHKTIDNGNIVLLKFNPWRFADENQLLESFFFALADKLKGRIKTKAEKAAEIVKNFSWVAAPLDSLKVGVLGLDVNLKVEETLKKLAEAKPGANITTLKERVEKILEASDKKILVVMDDIDRLDKEEIQAVFRLIKLSADFPNTIYLLSFDIERVSEALAEKYGSKEAGRSFLEKIIQVSLPLPPLTTTKLINLAFIEINKLLHENDIKLPQNEYSDWSYFFSKTFGNYLKSPRLVRKYINNLLFSLPVMKDELNIFDLQTIEAVHIFFPTLHEGIRNNRDIFLLNNPMLKYDGSMKRDESEKLVKLIEVFPESQRNHIVEVIRELFPQTAEALKELSPQKGFYQKWNNNKRIFSELYFDKYFSIGVSKDDISDNELKTFIDSLVSKTDVENKTSIEQLISNNRENVFLQKISIIVGDFGEEQSIKLAKAISLLGNLFPKDSQDIRALIIPPFSYAARLMSNLLENISASNRKEIAIEIASIASPLDFAYNFFHFAKSIRIERDTEDSELTELGKAIITIIVERTKKEANDALLEETYPQYSSELYYQWLVEDPETIKQYLKKRVEETPKDAEQFILSFLENAENTLEIGSITRLWGFDFIVEEIKRLHPKMQILPMENYSENDSYLSDSIEQFLQLFVSIAEKIPKDK